MNNDYHIKNIDQYHTAYKKSISDPEKFWEEIASNNFLWHRKWDSVLKWDFSKPEIKWFDGAKLNITENCIDRHLESRGDKTAIIFEPNNPNENAQHIPHAKKPKINVLLNSLL